MKRILLLHAVFGLFVFSSIGQSPSPTPPDDHVVRISTDLIQIDVTVTDKNGKVVPGLGIDDFEVFENGEIQKLSNFSFVSRTAGAATAGDAAKERKTDRTGSLQVNRTLARSTIAIVVDDLNLSFASVYYTRRSLKRFVDQQMRPDDLVAIVRTGSGVGALQQFTSDKALLHAAIDRIRWNPLGAAGVEALMSVGQTPENISERFNNESDLMARAGGDPVSNQRRTILTRENISDKKRTDYDGSRNAAAQDEGIIQQASLGTIKYLISAMASLPGRKTMLLFTDGLAINNDSNKARSSSTYDYLQDVVDVANRSSVVVYTFDTKGMKSMSIQASDSTYEVIDGHRGEKERERLEDFKDSQDGLAYFANRTGGKALLNSNDLNGGIQRALEEQAGYYLLAYQPDAEAFDPAKRKFNRLEVKVKRPGLNVAYRSGFFNTPGDGAQPQLTVDRQIANALVSPFSQSDIALNINAMFAEDAVDGPYIRSFLHIDAKSLKFSDEPEGWKKASFDVAAVTFGDNGLQVESIESKYTIKARGVTYTSMLERGFVYVLIMPVKTHGTYQYRVAVRDSETGKIGSASQIIEVPELGKNKLTLSSLAVEDVSMATWQNISAGKVGTGPGKIQVPSTLLYDTVLRQFKAGTVLRYGFEAYNAKAEGSALPKLETRARILQNNSVVIEGNLNKVDVSSQKDPRRVRVSGAILLKDTLQPGDYVLQLMTFDRAGKQTAMQLFPFEIVK
ncbi:MAG TPA: VWA domain-containing protein [Pyrinomonadaceae bacterium]